MDKVKDFSKTFQTMRNITYLSILGSLVVISALVYWNQHLHHKIGQKVYVVSSSGTFPAVNKDNRQVSVYEARNQVKTFMRLMFAHDAATYQDNVEAALQLIDDISGKRIYADFSKGEVRENYVRYNSHTTLEIDSVVLDMNTNPFTGKAYARQFLHYGNQQKMLPVGAKFELEPTFRSDINPFGLLITNFDFILYSPQTDK